MYLTQFQKKKMFFKTSIPRIRVNNEMFKIFLELLTRCNSSIHHAAGMSYLRYANVIYIKNIYIIQMCVIVARTEVVNRTFYIHRRLHLNVIYRYDTKSRPNAYTRAYISHIHTQSRPLYDGKLRFSIDRLVARIFFYNNRRAHCIIYYCLRARARSLANRRRRRRRRVQSLTLLFRNPKYAYRRAHIFYYRVRRATRNPVIAYGTGEKRDRRVSSRRHVSRERPRKAPRRRGNTRARRSPPSRPSTRRERLCTRKTRNVGRNMQ